MDFQKLLLKDRFYLQKQLNKLNALDKSSSSYSNFAAQLDQKIQTSIKQLALRQAVAVDITYPDLPVTAVKDELLALIRDHQVVIVAGETGSGKTTQLPKICLELGLGRQAMIAHTQPRRVAATSVAQRIADELQVPLGQAVGYQIRFNDFSCDSTLLKLMTDGVLLAEIAHDRFLQKYDCIIIDEAHERSLNIDFLLGYLKTILPKRPDLKVIITSATIDVERFSEHFNQAPIIQISGRSFPVEIRYLPVEQLSEERSLVDAVSCVLQEIISLERKRGFNGAGDVLVFLPGEKEIREISRELRHSDFAALDVLPLYGRLSVAEQRKIFQPAANHARRVVLATNVAETSLTVPGISYVIDSGLARISRYSARSKVQQLPIEKISQASAMQRSGRCGRVSAGVCYRLYEEIDFDLRPAFTEPEIQRTNLSSVILQMQLLRIGDVAKFPFVEMPDKRLINDGYKQLLELGALDERRGITALGRTMAQLPIDPKLARILLQAAKENSMAELLVIVAGLSIQDPRETPSDKKEAAREMHSVFKDARSDFSSLLHLWGFAEEQRQLLSKSQFKKMCSKRFLSAQRMDEWREVHRQLLLLCKKMQLNVNKHVASYDAIHKAVLTGFATQIGFQSESKIFEGARNRKFRIFPASNLFKKPPKWIVAAQLMETSQLYALQVAEIDVDWIASHLQHLLKFSYSEPHFSSKQGQVLAYEKASLYGLVISERKTVGFAAIDAPLAREIFIREGLVLETIKSQAKFYQHNKAQRQRLLAMEDKVRRRDVIVSDEQIFEFYQRLIPQTVSSVRSLESWLKKADIEQSQLLFADASVFQAQTVDTSAQQFPKSISFQGVDYRLHYKFEPGHIDDGVSVDIPVAALNRVPRFLFEWLVPGLLLEKVEALLKSLPKQIRKHLVPIPDTAVKLLGLLEIADASLPHSVAVACKKSTGLTIPLDAWQLDKIDNYYRMNFRLLDEQQNIIYRSRDLADLLKGFAGRVQASLDKVAKPQATEHFSRWDFDDLASCVELKSSGTLMQSYPAIKDNKSSVLLTLTDSPRVQSVVHRQGVNRLAILTLAAAYKYLQKNLLKDNELQLKLPANLLRAEVLEDLLLASSNHCFFADQLPYTKIEFELCLEKHRSALTAQAQQIEKILATVVKAAFSVRKRLSQLDEKIFRASLADIQQQLDALLYPGFLYQTPIENLAELPRYFSAIEVRLDRLAGNITKENSLSAEMAVLTERLSQLTDNDDAIYGLQKLQHYRWLLEEYRVSIFAQSLKTRVPVSQKRLDKLWDEVLLEQKLSNTA